MSGTIRINVYARSNGWLFDDLKKGFSRIQLRGAEIIISESPITSSDIWIAIRSSEVRLSPRLQDTVAIIHDVCHHDNIYLPGGERRAIKDAGAIVFSHPEERDILESYGIDIDDKLIHERPLGVLSIFTCRNSMPEYFTIGVVGRDCPRKRFKWVPEIARKLDKSGVSCRWMLVGKGFSEYQRIITESGIPCTRYPRQTYPVTVYPGLYQAMDCHLITSSSEAGPLTLFEALASGIPVASTPVGWAPMFEKQAPDYIKTAGDTNGLVENIILLKEKRRALFQRRRQISEIVSEYSLDDWFKAVINLAMELGSKNHIYKSHSYNYRLPAVIQP